MLHHWRTDGRLDGRGGLAPASVRSHFQVLRAALERAVQ